MIREKQAGDIIHEGGGGAIEVYRRSIRGDARRGEYPRVRRGDGRGRARMIRSGGDIIFSNESTPIRRTNVYEKRRDEENSLSLIKEYPNAKVTHNLFIAAEKCKRKWKRKTGERREKIKASRTEGKNMNAKTKNEKRIRRWESNLGARLGKGAAIQTNRGAQLLSIGKSPNRR